MDRFHLLAWLHVALDFYIEGHEVNLDLSLTLAMHFAKNILFYNSFFLCVIGSKFIKNIVNVWFELYPTYV